MTAKPIAASMERLRLGKPTWGWMLYDFANSSFTTVIVTVVYSVYFKNVVVNQGQYGTALWGRSVSLSMLLTALTAPLLGAMADYSSRRKLLLTIFTYACVAFTALLGTVKAGDIMAGMLFFVLANYAFNSANVFYNAFLPDVSTPATMGRVSGLAWGIGYIGGLASLFMVLPVATTHTRVAFVLIALFFGIFFTFTLVWLKENRTSPGGKKHFKVALSRIKYSLSNIKKLPQLLRFIISYFIFNDGIVVVIAFSSIYGAEQFGMNTRQLIQFFIVVQSTAFAGAVAFGWLLDRLGAKPTMLLTLVIWSTVVLGAYFCNSVNHYYLVGLVAGLAMGSSQSTARTMLARLTPRTRMAEFFGFYSFSGKLASIAGPFIFGEIARISGNQRTAILSVLAFFAVGAAILATVNEAKGQHDAIRWDKGE